MSLRAFEVVIPSSPPYALGGSFDDVAGNASLYSSAVGRMTVNR